MTTDRPPPDERPTARQLAAAARSGDQATCAACGQAGPFSARRVTMSDGTAVVTRVCWRCRARSVEN